MKKLLLAILLIAAPLAPIALTTGCATTQTVSYNTLKATVATVDSTMSAYADMVVAGKVNPETQNRVKVIYTEYEVAVRAAIVAAKFNYSTATPKEVSFLVSDLLAAIQSILK